MVINKVGCQNSPGYTKCFPLISQKGVTFNKRCFFILSLLIFCGRNREILNNGEYLLYDVHSHKTIIIIGNQMHERIIK